MQLQEGLEKMKLKQRNVSSSSSLFLHSHHIIYSDKNNYVKQKLVAPLLVPAWDLEDEC